MRVTALKAEIAASQGTLINLPRKPVYALLLLAFPARRQVPKLARGQDSQDLGFYVER
jgi:hypothetical protein